MHGPMGREGIFAFTTLRARLLLLILFATFPAVLFILFVASQEREALIARMESNAQHVVHLASREHGHQIRGARELLHWLGRKIVAGDAAVAAQTDADFLQALLAGHPQLANIGLLSPEGAVLASAYPMPSSTSMADNPAFVAALASTEVVTGTYVVSPIFKRPTLNHAYAVRDSTGRVNSVLFCGLDLRWLGNLAREVDYQGPYAMLIADRDGHVLTYADAEGTEEVSAGGIAIPEIATLAATGGGRPLKIVGTQVERYLVAAALEEDPALFVAVSLPYEAVMQQSRAVFYKTLVVLALLTLFTATTVYFATEIAVLRLLRTLVAAVRRFGAGDLGVRVPNPTQHNELSALARTFNAMADSLEARHREALESQARLRALSGRLHQAREEEAARISRELHDEIGQLLTSLKLDLARLRRHCPEGGLEQGCGDRLGQDIDSMGQQISAGLDFVRRIASDLRPSVLDKLGIAAALDWQAQETESRSGLAVTVDTEDFCDRLDEQTAVTLFRIAQEALTNVVRHAGASHVRIRLTQTPDGTLLEVTDDGRGFAVEIAEHAASLGITGMRERAMLIGAVLSIESEPGAGTRLRVLVPE